VHFCHRSSIDLINSASKIFTTFSIACLLIQLNPIKRVSASQSYDGQDSAYGALCLSGGAFSRSGRIVPVMAYGIQQRNREIGVRLALGATRATILRMIFKEGALLLAAGITAGFIIALALARLVASQMYGVNECDPFSFAVVGLIYPLFHSLPVQLQPDARRTSIPLHRCDANRR
jgi:hypothetical protein